MSNLESFTAPGCYVMFETKSAVKVYSMPAGVISRINDPIIDLGADMIFSATSLELDHLWILFVKGDSIISCLF